MQKVLLIGLDYELFFGPRVGTVERCLLAPTDAIVELLAKCGGRLTLFVDAGFVWRLSQTPAATREFRKVALQLENVVRAGHEVQLHVHPHWEDSHFINGEWQLDVSRYRLHEFGRSEQLDLLSRYSDALANIVGYRPNVYRAGGWCIQPFHEISASLADVGIDVDSTIYARGSSEDAERTYDFKTVEAADYWRFSNDPTERDDSGPFLEIPITSVKVPGYFHWLDQLLKRTNPTANQSYGDGAYLPHDASYILRRLTRSSYAPASIDGGKARLLEAAWQAAGDVVNIMGHPKSLTKESLRILGRFVDSHKIEPLTISRYAKTCAAGGSPECKAATSIKGTKRLE